MQINLDECIKKIGKSLTKTTSSKVVAIPQMFYENGLDWMPGDFIEVYYDKKQDVIIIKRQTFDGLVNARQKTNIHA
jgi:hypothetical protein